MGLKLQHSYNLLPTLLKNKHDAGALIFASKHSQIDLNNRLLKLVNSIGFDTAQVSMDRLFEQNNREYLRNTMMRQEDIFKQQVHELHRLYRVQKILMTELKTSEAPLYSRPIPDTKNKYWSSTSTSETSHSSYISNRHHAAPQIKSQYNYLHQHKMLAEEPSARDKGFDLERPAKGEATISHVQSEEFWDDEVCDVELTLSIGCSSSKKKPENWVHPETTTSETRQLILSNTGDRAERAEECSETEGLQRPAWLYQAMSLNRT